MFEGKRERIGLSNIICEAVGCYSKVKIKFNLRVGHKGTLPVFVCESCVTKFSASMNSEYEVNSCG